MSKSPSSPSSRSASRPSPSTRSPALRPFIRALEPFDESVAQAFGKWLPRLALMFGPLAHSAKEGGDPDGYEGVSKKGPYERLLLSEWALALELPDEFVRRAAMHEHLFVELKRQEPHGVLQSLLVVDPGPDQLGAPRLAHIAAALVGELRAQRAKASFAWGATTEPVRLFSSVDVPSVRTMLEMRRAAPLELASLERWHVAVSRFDGTVDVLFVGGAHLEKMVAQSPFAGSARVMRVDAPSTKHSLFVSIGNANEKPDRPSRRKLELPLPDDDVCVRALRDPFEQEKKDSPVPVLDVVAAAGLCIPLGGRRVFVRTHNGVAALMEPNSPRAPIGPAKHLGLGPSDQVLAVALVGRRPLALVRGIRGKLAVIFANHRYDVAGDVVRAPFGDRIDDGGDRMRLLMTIGGEAPLDGGKTPVPIPGVDGRARGFAVENKGYAFLPFHRTVSELRGDFVLGPMTHKNDKLSVRASLGNVVVTANSERISIRSGHFGRTYLGALRAAGKVPGALAFEAHRGRWVIVSGNQHETIDAPLTDVVGCVHHPLHGPCVVVREDKRRLAFVNNKAIERHAFAVDIAAVAPNLELPQLAVLTVDGTVTILFMKTGVRQAICRPSPTQTARPPSSSEIPYSEWGDKTPVVPTRPLGGTSS